jgi:hypothetical protein
LKKLDNFSAFLNFLRVSGAEKIEAGLKMMEPVKYMAAESRGGWRVLECDEFSSLLEAKGAAY